MQQNHPVLVIGGGAIGSAIAAEFAKRGRSVFLASRHETKLQGVTGLVVNDWSEAQLQRVAKDLPNLSAIVVATGLLHDEAHGIAPEKALGDITPEAMTKIMQVNAVFPALCGKVFLPKLDAESLSIMAILSARVGSISDNRLGGWYSYRMSKAAVNMFVKTASIELVRKNKQAALVGLHPGTVDSALSEPFQRNVPEGKLFTPEYSAEKLVDVMLAVTPEHTGKCYDYAGDEVHP